MRARHTTESQYEHVKAAQRFLLLAFCYGPWTHSFPYIDRKIRLWTRPFFQHSEVDTQTITSRLVWHNIQFNGPCCRARDSAVRDLRFGSIQLFSKSSRRGRNIELATLNKNRLGNIQRMILYSPCNSPKYRSIIAICCVTQYLFAAIGL